MHVHMTRHQELETIAFHLRSQVLFHAYVEKYPDVQAGQL